MTLDQIMLKYPATDKSSIHHDYCKTYERFFAPLRYQPILLFEVGVGGYQYPDRGGADLLGFAEYFPLAQIHAIDIHPKTGLDKGRISTHVCSQDDEPALKVLIEKIGAPDIIIDDGSHVNPLTIRTFEILFPLLKDGGIYVVEDAHTSYWPDAGFEGCEDRENKTHPHIHNYISKQLALAKDLGGGMELLHRDEKLIILRK